MYACYLASFAQERLLAAARLKVINLVVNGAELFNQTGGVQVQIREPPMHRLILLVRVGALPPVLERQLPLKRCEVPFPVPSCRHNSRLPTFADPTTDGRAPVRSKCLSRFVKRS